MKKSQITKFHETNKALLHITQRVTLLQTRVMMLHVFHQDPKLISLKPR